MPLEVKANAQVKVIAGDIYGLIDERRQTAGAHGRSLRRLKLSMWVTILAFCSCLLDAIQQFGYFTGLQVAIDSLQFYTGLLRLFHILCNTMCCQMFCTLCRMAPSGY